MSMAIVLRVLGLTVVFALLLTGCSTPTPSATGQTEFYGGLVVFLRSDNTTVDEGLEYRVENRTIGEWSLILPVQVDAVGPNGAWVAIPDPQGNRVRDRATGELFTLEPGDATPWRLLALDKHAIEPGKHRLRLPMREAAEHSRIDLVVEFRVDE